MSPVSSVFAAVRYQHTSVILRLRAVFEFGLGAGPVPIRSRAKLLVATLADWLESLGGIPPWRVLAQPFPGAAMERDVLAPYAREGRLCELSDGVLVEKGMGCGADQELS